MMPEIVIENQPTEAKEVSTPQTVLVGKSEMLENAVLQAFDIDQKDRGLYQDKINTLLSYAKSQGQEVTPANVKWIIRNLEMKLGSPPLSEKRINYVSRYAYLHGEKAKIDREMKTYNPFGEES